MFILILCVSLFFPLITLADVKVDFVAKARELSVTSGSMQFKVPTDVPDNLFADGEIVAVEAKNHIVVVLPLSYGEGSTTYLFALTRMGKKLWHYDLNGFNPAIPLVDGNYVYTGAIGVVAKLSLETGKEVWKHTGLNERRSISYEGSDKIRREGPWVVFANNLKVNDKTGKIRKVLQ